MAKREIVLFNSQNPNGVSAFRRIEEFITIGDVADRHLIGIELKDRTKVQVFKLSKNEYIPYWLGDNAHAQASSDRCRFESIKELIINLKNIEVAYTFDQPEELIGWLMTNTQYNESKIY